MFYTENIKCQKCGTFFQNRGYCFTYRETQPDGTVKQRRSTAYETRKDAEIAYGNMSAELEKGKARRGASARYDMTVREMCELYINSVLVHGKESSARKIEYVVKKYIYDCFDCEKLAREVTSAELRAWQDNLAQQSLSAKYRRMIRGAFSSAFNNAREYMIDNPFRYVKGVKNTDPQKKMEVWSEPEFLQFLSVIPKGTIDYAYFAFMYIMGTRRGEALSLRWKDINFDTHIVTINKTVTRDTYDGSYKVTTPKTHNSNREVELPNNLEQILRELKASEEAGEDDIVFHGSNKQSFYPFNTLSQHQQKYIRLSDVKKIRGHDLRHSSVAFMISKSHEQLTTLYDIAARIGDTVEQVMKTYGHLFPRKKKDYLEYFNSIKI